MEKMYLGIDVGSVSTKCALLNADMELVISRYIATAGKPIIQIQKLLSDVKDEMPPNAVIAAAGTTGSARYLAGEIIGADAVKNEITTHAVAAIHYFPDVRTVLEIGGQDSKVIIIRDGIVTDFGMNTVCAAGTGSFLDHQALRIGISIEDLGAEALKSRNPVRIAGRCTVFAESDMIHKQQMGHATPDILYGLCQALVRNYISNVALGKDLQSPVIFQGGVAFNQAIIKAFEEELGHTVTVPAHHEVMGAIGVAILAREAVEGNGTTTRFKGFQSSATAYETSSFICNGCPNQCEIARLTLNGVTLACWGGRCEKWERVSDNGTPDEEEDSVLTA